MKQLGLALLLVGCGASRGTWLVEVNQLAMQPLDCSETRVVTSNHIGHTYDTVGCGKAIRYTCQDQVCSPSGDVQESSATGFSTLQTRADAARVVLAENADALKTECTDGEAFGVRLLVNPDGTIYEVRAHPSQIECLQREIPTLPAGRGAMVISHFFP